MTECSESLGLKEIKSVCGCVYICLPVFKYSDYVGFVIRIFKVFFFFLICKSEMGESDCSDTGLTVMSVLSPQTWK